MGGWLLLLTLAAMVPAVIRAGPESGIRASTEPNLRGGTIAVGGPEADNGFVRHLPKLRATPAAVVAATLAVEVSAIGLSWGLEPAYDTLLYALYTVSLAVAGALITSCHPRHPVGWLFAATALFTAVTADLAQGWGLRAASRDWPGGTAAEWVALTSWVPSALPLTLTFLLFPDGRLSSRMGRPLVWASLVGVALALPGWALDPGLGVEFVAGRNPFAVEGLATDPLFAAGAVLLTGALVGSVVLLVQRLRRSVGPERQQMKWFVFAAAFAGVVLPSSALLWTVTPVVRPLAAIALTALPVGACIAILRYRLYDIDVVVSRTVAYTVVTAVLIGAYAGSALVVGTAVGRGSAWATAVGTLVVAVGFRPVRDRVQTRVDRRFNRVRSDALQRVTAFIEDLRGGRAAPEEIEAVLQEAAGDGGLKVRLFLPESEVYVDLDGNVIPPAMSAAAGESWSIRQSGTILGEVAVEETSEWVRALLPQLIDAAALAIEITRLRVELRRQLAAVEASRARIVAVADEERRRIERDLHDGAQQRLVSIGLALRHAQHALESGVAPVANRAIDGAVAEITEAICELRELARGLRPASLDGGLGPALLELARRAPLPVEVHATPDRFSPDAESAAYFIACEGLTNAAKHAQANRVVLSADRADGKLVVTVTDDGIGGATIQPGSGLMGLYDRVAAHGGSLSIDSAPGDGTVLVAEVPCAS